MKRHIHRFVDWMEKGPAILTIWFLPLLAFIGIIAVFVNRFNRKDILTK